MCAPMVVALVAIPLLIRGLGEERFGLLSLVWMIVGYFGVFDLGLGRALTKVVAERLGGDRRGEVAPVFWTAMTVMTALGALGGILVWFGAPWLTQHALKIALPLQPETLQSFRAVAVGLPVIVTIAGLVGTLEACRRFLLINAIRIPTGAFTFVGPLLVLPFSESLYPVVLVLLAGRLFEWAIFFFACWRRVPGVRERQEFRAGLVPGLLGFGGWMTVSNLVIPLLVHIDRFLIGSIRKVAEVAFYVTPAEIVVKLLILPRAWVSVLFPTFAAHVLTRPDETARLYGRSVRLLLALLFPLVLVIVLFAAEGLDLWLGGDFAERSTPVMQLLSVGMFVYSLAFIPTALLQGSGRPDLSARVHAIELPLYLVLAPMLIRSHGIAGAAAAWCIRASFDAVCMHILAARVAPGTRAGGGRTALAAVFAVGILLAGTAVAGLPAKVGAALLGIAVFSAACWFWLFSAADRSAAVALLPRSIRPRRGA